jgi:hypothetical protein
MSNTVHAGPNSLNPSTYPLLHRLHTQHTPTPKQGIVLLDLTHMVWVCTARWSCRALQSSLQSVEARGILHVQTGTATM